MSGRRVWPHPILFFFKPFNIFQYANFSFALGKCFVLRIFKSLLIGSPRASGDIHGLRLCVGLLPRCFEPFGRQDIRTYQDIAQQCFCH